MVQKVRKKVVFKKRIKKCRVCPEENLVHVETPEKYHKAKLICGICSKHNRWTHSYLKQYQMYCRQFKMLIALKSELSLNIEEFIREIFYQKKNLSPSQYFYLEKILLGLPDPDISLEEYIKSKPQLNLPKKKELVLKDIEKEWLDFLNSTKEQEILEDF